MSVPQYEHKRAQLPIASAAQVLKQKRELGLLPKLEAPASLVMCDSIDPSIFAHTLKGMRLPWPNVNLWEFAVNGSCQHNQPVQRMAWLAAGYGNSSATAVELVELATAAGIRSIVNVEPVTSISDHLQLGTIVLCDKALRDDGASHHYSRTRNFAYASLDALGDAMVCLEESKIQFVKAPLWTCDAPYTITKEELEVHKHEGIVGIDRCSSGIYTVASRRQARACTVAVLGDKLTENGWEFGPQQDLYSLVMRVLTHI